MTDKIEDVDVGDVVQNDTSKFSIFGMKVKKMYVYIIAIIVVLILLWLTYKWWTGKSKTVKTDDKSTASNLNDDDIPTYTNDKE